MSLRSSSGVDSTYCSSDEGGSSSAEAQRQHAAAAANETVEELREALQGVNLQFLKIEKFANLNIRACYKILKKHDKLIPATVCCLYYLERLHQQPWIRADHSAVFVVQMADLFTKLRGTRIAQASSAQGNGSKGGSGVQDFVRTTQKYWVSTEDVSSVKAKIGQHLPVFLMEREKNAAAAAAAALRSMNGGGGGGGGGEGDDGVAGGIVPAVAPADSQLTSSVYLDNVNLGGGRDVPSLFLSLFLQTTSYK